MQTNDRLFLIVDPISLRLVDLCQGPDSSGKCPSGETRPYSCEGHHVIPLRGTDANGLSFRVTAATVDAADPHRCPMAWIDDPSNEATPLRYSAPINHEDHGGEADAT